MILLIEYGHLIYSSCFLHVAVVLEAGNIGSTVAGIVLIYSLSFCEALTFLARAHADVSLLLFLLGCYL